MQVYVTVSALHKRFNHYPAVKIVVY